MGLYLLQVQSSADVETDFSKWGKGHITRETERLVAGLALGAHTGSLDVQKDPASAVGVLAIASGTGSVGGTIGGQAVTATWATSDANSADLVAAAINADATAKKFVSASSRAATATVTISSGSGNISATITAPGELAARNAARTYTVAWATSDANTASLLAAAINADGTSPVIAVAASNVVTLYARTTGTAGNTISLSASGTGATASAAALSGGGTNANVVIAALVPGTVGTGITLVASGTGVTAPTGARLVAGVGAPGNSFTI